MKMCMSSATAMIKTSIEFKITYVDELFEFNRS